jgi:hypothetical protein
VLFLVLILAAFLVSGVLAWAGTQVTAELRRSRAEAMRTRALQIMELLGPGLAACADDPRALLVWQPLATTARKAFPEECALLDASAGGTFPFSIDQLSAAHAKWTTRWLEWERSHDAEYKLKAAAAASELTAAGSSALTRARVDAVEQEKLERYQRRYEEYIRTAKALQQLIEKPGRLN